MSWLHGIRHRLRTWLRPRAYARELDEEIAFHLELDAASAGSQDARRRFGNTTFIREEARRMTLHRFTDMLRNDLRYAYRTLLRSPRLTSLVVLTLTLGVGINAATFSVLDAVFLRMPGGVQSPDDLRRVWRTYYRTGDGRPFASQNISYGSYQGMLTSLEKQWRHALHTSPSELRIGPNGQRSSAQVVYADSQFFPLLGVTASRGRLFAPSENILGKGAPVAVVSDAYWRTALGARENVVGSTLRIEKEMVTLIGVLPPGFGGIDLNPVDIWMPLGSMPSPEYAKEGWWTSENVNILRVLLRPMPGASEATLAADLTNRIRAVNRERYGVNGDTLAEAILGSLIESRRPLSRDQGALVSSRIFGVGAIILVIALANVINLLLARAAERKREVAVRLAVGISRARLATLFVAESMVVATLAGCAAFIAGALGAAVLRAALFPDIKWTGSVFDPRVALFTIAVTLVVGIVVGLPPALVSSKTQLTDALKAGVRSSGNAGSRLRASLVIAQVALSVTLLVGAALFVRSLRNVQGLDLGFDVPKIVLASSSFEDAEAPPLGAMAEIMRGVQERVARIPGVESVARVSMTPMTGFGVREIFVGADSLGSMGTPMPTLTVATPSYFATTGVAVLRGRIFESGSSNGPREVVINEAMARQVWKGADPLGACVQIESRQAPCHVVVGIVANSRRSELIERDANPIFYLALGGPAAQSGGRTVIARVDPSSAGKVMPLIERELRNALPMATVRVRSMTEQLAPSYRPWRLGASLFSVFGALALLVAVVGVYSTVSYSVSQRQREFGIRVALGGRFSQVAGGVMRESVRTVAIGVAAGLLVSIAAGRGVAALLYDVAPTDASAFATASLLLLLAALVASALPARRAARVDPARVLGDS